MESKIKSLEPNQFIESFMCFGGKRNEVFKNNFELFYIARLEEVSQISKPPIPPVKARTHTFFFLTSGILSIKIGPHAIKIGANESLMIPAGQVFSYSDVDMQKSEPGTGFMCGFNNDFLIGKIGSQELLNTFEFLNIWGNPAIRPTGKSATYLTQSLNRIFDEFSANALQHKVIIQAHLIALLCDLNKDYFPLSNHQNKTAVELTNRFKELLHQNIKTMHKVSDFAAQLNISPNHLNKTIKLITQKSPSVWIRETLINESKVLLFQSDLSIQEIASELGIDDQSYFARLFKKQEGITPAHYRKMIDLS